MLSILVWDKARNTGSVTVEEVENHYLLRKVGPGGKHVGVQNVSNNLVHRMRQRRTRFLATDGMCMANLEWGSNRVSTVATLWPRRLPRFPCSPTQPLGYDHYRLLGHSVLDALIDKKNKCHQPTKKETECYCGAENRHGCQQTGSSNTQRAALNVTKNRYVMRYECARPRALSSSLSAVG